MQIWICICACHNQFVIVSTAFSYTITSHHTYNTYNTYNTSLTYCTGRQVQMCVPVTVTVKMITSVSQFFMVSHSQYNIQFHITHTNTYTSLTYCANCQVQMCVSVSVCTSHSRNDDQWVSQSIQQPSHHQITVKSNHIYITSHTHTQSHITHSLFRLSGANVCMYVSVCTSHSHSHSNHNDYSSQSVCRGQLIWKLRTTQITSLTYCFVVRCKCVYQSQSQWSHYSVSLSRAVQHSVIPSNHNHNQTSSHHITSNHRTTSNTRHSPSAPFVRRKYVHVYLPVTVTVTVIVTVNHISQSNCHGQYNNQLHHQIKSNHTYITHNHTSLTSCSVCQVEMCVCKRVYQS